MVRGGAAKGRELVIPNPKLNLLDQVREVLRVKHYAIRTEQAYCEWIRRYVRFHGMRSREAVFPGTDKVELFDDLHPRAPAGRQRDEKPAGLPVNR